MLLWESYLNQKIDVISDFLCIVYEKSFGLKSSDICTRKYQIFFSRFYYSSQKSGKEG